MDWKEARKQILSDPEVKAHYDELKPQYQYISEIIKIRRLRKVTQAELARRVGTTQSAIARLESGRANPTLETLEKIADVLDCQLSVSFKRRKASRKEDEDPSHSTLAFA